MRSGPSPKAGLLLRKATLALTTLWACLTQGKLANLAPSEKVPGGS